MCYSVEAYMLRDIGYKIVYIIRFRKVKQH